MRVAHRLATAALVSLVLVPALSAFDDTFDVRYTPAIKQFQGDAPLATSYSLTITAPPVILPGTTSITPVISVLSAPAGVPTATALSYISLSPVPLAFSVPFDEETTTVSINVPVGAVAGDYAYKVSTLSQWPAGTTEFSPAVINMKVTEPVLPAPPLVAINSPADTTVYTYNVGGPAVSIPFSMSSSAPADKPITSLAADINGTPFSLTSTGIGTGSATGTATISLTTGGAYTITGRANNTDGTSSSSVHVTVIAVAPPPTVVINLPTLTSYSMVSGGPSLSIPFSFTATSRLGGIQSLSASLNGTPVAVTQTGLLGLVATGTGTLSIDTGGTFTFVVSATDANGTNSASRTITVAVTQPALPPTVTIFQPVDGATYTHVAGSPALSIPVSFTAYAPADQKVSAVSATLNGAAVTLSKSSLNKPSVTASATLNVTTPGTYTFVASGVSSGKEGFAQVSFTVNETQPEPAPCTVLWLPPVSLGTVQRGGSTLPVKFELECCAGTEGDDDNDVEDQSVVVIVAEVYSNGDYGPATTYTYAAKKDPNPPHYTISGKGQYHLNVPTAKGKHVYHISVYSFASDTPQLVGTREFSTK